jgi:hypothetical protein
MQILLELYCARLLKDSKYVFQLFLQSHYLILWLLIRQPSSPSELGMVDIVSNRIIKLQLNEFADIIWIGVLWWLTFICSFSKGSSFSFSKMGSIPVHIVTPVATWEGERFTWDWTRFYLATALTGLCKTCKQKKKKFWYHKKLLLLTSPF